jgi:hypothetical protein
MHLNPHYILKLKPSLKPVNKGSIQPLLQKCMICLLELELDTPGIKGFGVVDMEQLKLAVIFLSF